MIIVCPRRCRRRLSRASAVSSSGNFTLLLQAALGPKYKAAFATAYGAGCTSPKVKKSHIQLSRNAPQFQRLISARTAFGSIRTLGSVIALVPVDEAY